MILELSKKDNYWRKVAYNICKDKMLADDLVNDMYLRLFDCSKEINDFYVIITIKNLFLQYLKQNKTVELIDNFITNEPFTLDDNEEKIIKEMYWVAKEYIILNEDHSLREIGKMLNTNYSFIHKTITKEKNKWQKK